MNWKITMLALFGITLILAGVALFVRPRSTPETPDNPDSVFCTMDAMQCSDGSWVGRTGPNCEFVCPGE